MVGGFYHVSLFDWGYTLCGGGDVMPINILGMIGVSAPANDATVHIVGGGIDPGHYPSNGRKGYQANSNRAIAMILAEAGLFNYTQLRTPYYYKGHCDVGPGTGNLTYTSSTSCFTKIDQMNFNPDLIVVDLMMPEMDGIEALKEIRAKYSTKVIVVSSVAQMGSSRAAEVNQLGADAIIEKPGGAVDPTLATQKGKEFIEIARKVLDLD